MLSKRFAAMWRCFIVICATWCIKIKVFSKMCGEPLKNIYSQFHSMQKIWYYLPWLPNYNPLYWCNNSTLFWHFRSIDFRPYHCTRSRNSTLNFRQKFGSKLPGIERPESVPPTWCQIVNSQSFSVVLSRCLSLFSMSLTWAGKNQLTHINTAPYESPSNLWSRMLMH